jgi:hypothetical protein
MYHLYTCEFARVDMSAPTTVALPSRRDRPRQVAAEIVHTEMLHLLFCCVVLSQELRKTLEDGNLVIDIVRTLRGAECEEASFEPPALKPAKISGAVLDSWPT